MNIGIVDIGAAKLADTPEAFDVIVMPNLYGDILSDVAAQIAGSVGLAGSANIGLQGAMFEAIHGSAPRIAGQNSANPSGLIQGAVMMLVHIGQSDVAQRVQNAWLKTIEDGIHTKDIYSEEHSKQKVGTQEFANAVIERLGQEPSHLKPVRYAKSEPKVEMRDFYTKVKPAKRELVGVDVFMFNPEPNAEKLAEKLLAVPNDLLELKIITNRGVKVWPQGLPETFCTDHWRCRFKFKQGVGNNEAVAALLTNFARQGLDFIKTEHLYQFDGQPGYSLGQGE